METIQSQSTALLTAFATARPHLERLCPDDAREFFTLVEEKSTASRPVITVYGIYSHGKSSLINALLGRYAAEVSEEPKTDKPQNYEWRGYTLTDTPGIDAPIEHTKIAEEQLYKSEVVLFVVDSSSTSLHQAQDKLVKMAKNQQRVCLIVNDRDGCLREPEILVRIKDDFSRKLQDGAKREGFEGNILDLIPILFVNPLTALKAKQENKATLLKGSGISELEQALERFFAALPAGQKWRRLQGEFSKLILSCENTVVAQTKDRRLQEVRKNIQRIEQEEKYVREDIVDELDRRLGALKNQIRSGLDGIQTENDAPRILTPIVQGFGDAMGEFCKTRLEEAGRKVEDICLSYDDFSLSLDADAFAQTDEKNAFANAVQSLPWTDLLKGMQWDTVLKDGIVEVLKFAKEALPELFKGVGAKTMAKWATGFLKVLGPVVAVITILWDFFQADQAEQEAREAAQRKARQLDDAAASIVENIRQAFMQQMNKIISDLFTPLKKQFQDEVDKLSTTDKEGERSLENLRGIQKDIAALFQNVALPDTGKSS